MNNIAIKASIRGAARFRMSIWAEALEEHRGHPTFKTVTWAHQLELGFFCLCSGEREEWRLGVRTLKEMEPEARGAFLRLVKHHQDRGCKKAKRWMRQMRRADKKAKALLHRYLTQEQKWDLRATKGFNVTGQDGVVYWVKGSGGVLLPGTPFGWCIHSDSKTTILPPYDLMLAQKVLLESDIEAFMATAHKFGKKPPATNTRPRPFLDLDNEDLDNPGPWATARLREAEPCG